MSKQDGAARDAVAELERRVQAACLTRGMEPESSPSKSATRRVKGAVVSFLDVTCGVNPVACCFVTGGKAKVGGSRGKRVRLD